MILQPSTPPPLQSSILPSFHIFQEINLPIKAITFDFWSTLYQSKSVDYSKRLRMLKEAVERGSGSAFLTEQFEAAVRMARETWSRTWNEEHRAMTADEWLAVMLRELRLTPVLHFGVSYAF